jgi:hypothetical protein
VEFGRYSPQPNRHGENEHWSPILGRRLCDQRQPRLYLRRAVAASPNSTAVGRAAPFTASIRHSLRTCCIVRKRRQ